LDGKRPEHDEQQSDEKHKQLRDGWQTTVQCSATGDVETETDRDETGSRLEVEHE
jgi:hypothetical protein